MTGGGYDAGDLRKWMTAIPPDLAALFAASSASRIQVLLKTYRKSDVKTIFQDAGFRRQRLRRCRRGLVGDNSDNHWTDNVTGNSDDRYINPSKSPASVHVHALSYRGAE
jgi:hypothetical protein